MEISFGNKDEYKQEQAFRVSSIIEWLNAFLMVRKISWSDCYVAEVLSIYKKSNSIIGPT